MRYDLTDLRLLLAVADAGSITHGAAELGLSLPAASERLRDMETEGKVKLLRRGRRGVSLTDAGEACARHARLIMGQMASLKYELGEHAKGVRTIVRVLANTAAIAEHLPGRLASWMAANPQLDIDLSERPSLEIARSVATGFADLGVLSEWAAHDALLLRPFAIDRLVLVTAPKHPLAEKPRARLIDVAGEHFIGLAEGALQSHIDDQAKQMGFRLKQRVKLRTFEAVCELAMSGAGIGIVPEKVARRFPGLPMIALQDSWSVRRLSVCVRRGSMPAPAAQSLFAHLAADLAFDDVPHPTGHAE